MLKPIVFGTLLLSFSPALFAGDLSGTVKVDGSSTVFPITEAVGEEFQKAHPKVRVTVGIAGTGGGMKKFTVGEIDIADASRPMKEVERQIAAKNKISYIELPVAYDGLSVVVNSKNTFVKSMTVAELKKIWEPGSKVTNWSDVRANWPKRKIKLYGPGADSGTFDYFTEVINGEARKSRADYTASEDDNTLVQGVAGDVDALGYFGHAYYEENKAKLNAVAIDSGEGPVLPTDETIKNGTYKPLSRPLLIYVSKESAERPEIDMFVKFYLEQAGNLVHQVGYLPLEKQTYAAAQLRYQNKMLGTVFGAQNRSKTAKMEDLLKLKGE